jgi:DNA invertase Pin-like site-specific DNA recombinase
MKVAIYARYSTENQREASIDDQVRVCTARADKEAWAVAEVYPDYALSGATFSRPRLQALIADAKLGKFSVVLAEALDRISRDQEHIAGIWKTLTFTGVKLITLAEGEINELHVGLKGTMNALFLKDLAAKTHRGLAGRVEEQIRRKPILRLRRGETVGRPWRANPRGQIDQPGAGTSGRPHFPDVCGRDQPDRDRQGAQCRRCVGATCTGLARHDHPGPRGTRHGHPAQ